MFDYRLTLIINKVNSKGLIYLVEGRKKKSKLEVKNILAKARAEDIASGVLNKIENNFVQHSASTEMVAKMEAVRNECATLAKLIETTCPDGREKSLANTKLEEVMFWTNAGISRNSKD